MKLRIAMCVLLLSFVGAAFGQQPAKTADDAARRAIDMLAGPAWEKARYLAFTFDVEREGKIVASFPQRYDRWTGDYRVSGKVKEDDVVVVMNVNTKKGRAWKNGTEVSDPAELLTFGHRRFINDTYWLLMPLKSMDPGVHRELAESTTGACGQSYDVVRLSFDQGVGLTPADVYWMWVNRDTGLVDEWHMKLQGSKPEDQPSTVLFHDYRRIGGLLLSTRREIKGRNQFILLNDVTVSETVPNGAFGL
jgi:hypothetical protein